MSSIKTKKARNKGGYLNHYRNHYQLILCLFALNSANVQADTNVQAEPSAQAERALTQPILCYLDCEKASGELLPENPSGVTAIPQDKIKSDFWGRDSTKSYYLEDANATEGGLNHRLNEMFENLTPYQETLGTRVDRLGQSVDEWIGDSEYFESQRSNRLEVKFPIGYRLDNGTFEFTPQFQAKVYFPNTNQRWSLMVESTRDALGNVTEKDANNNVAVGANKQDDKVNLTLQKLMVDNPYFTIRTDLGGTFKGIEPDPMAGFRLEYILPTSDSHQNRLIQRAYWQRLVGNVFDTQYRHDWLLDAKHLVRADSRATWWNDEDYWTLSQSLGYYQSINAHRFFSYTLRSDWQTEPNNIRHESVGIGWGWRETVYKQWVFARLSPYLNYRRDAERKIYFFEPSITLSLELSFYDVKKD